MNITENCFLEGGSFRTLGKNKQTIISVSTSDQEVVPLKIKGQCNLTADTTAGV